MLTVSAKYRPPARLQRGREPYQITMQIASGLQFDPLEPATPLKFHTLDLPVAAQFIQNVP
jgi:hypothetical protein